jgi:uncharacterized membrane protein
MIKTIKNVLAGLLIVPALALSVSLVAPIAQPVSAALTPGTSGIQDGLNSAQPEGVPDTLDGSDGIFKTIVNILLFIIGAIAVIMLIIGGIRYTISGGDSSAVTGAKNTILYAIIGIVVALLAYAIVNFVIDGILQT